MVKIATIDEPKKNGFKDWFEVGALGTAVIIIGIKPIELNNDPDKLL